MKKTLLSVMTALAVMSLSAQDKINSTELSTFSSITISGNMDVRLLPAEANSVETILADCDPAKFKHGVSDNNLMISYQTPRGSTARPSITIYYNYNQPLNSISIASADFRAEGPILSDILRFSVSNGAKVTADFESIDLDISVGGNSVAQLSGNTKYLTMKASERSKADARELESLTADVDASTGAEVTVYVTERIIANAKTNSTIFYRGTPSITKDRSSKLSTGVMGSSVLPIGK